MNVLKVLLAAIFVAASLSGATLEDYDKIISEEKNPADKQRRLCEREVIFISKDPTLCIKAAQIYLKEYDDILQKGYNSHKGEVAAMYFNAAIIYSKIGDNGNKVKMLTKVLEFSPNDEYSNYFLGTAYYFGEAVDTNKTKAYGHWNIAAKQGNQQAQKNCDILCKESPWACK